MPRPPKKKTPVPRSRKPRKTKDPVPEMLQEGFVISRNFGSPLAPGEIRGGRPPGRVIMGPILKKNFLAMIRKGIGRDYAMAELGISFHTYKNTINEPGEGDPGRTFHAEVCSAERSSQDFLRTHMYAIALEDREVLVKLVERWDKVNALQESKRDKQLDRKIREREIEALRPSDASKAASAAPSKFNLSRLSNEQVTQFTEIMSLILGPDETAKALEEKP